MDSVVSRDDLLGLIEKLPSDQMNSAFQVLSDLVDGKFVDSKDWWSDEDLVDAGRTSTAYFAAQFGDDDKY